MAIKLKRWKLRKYDIRNNCEVNISPPEPVRHYWTVIGAYKERARLNASMAATGLPWRYKVYPR